MGTTDDLIEAYRGWLAGRDYSTSTIIQRTGFAGTVLRAWGTFDVTGQQLAEWLGRHHGWTRITYLNHLASIYDFLADTGRLEANPARHLRRPRNPLPRSLPLTVDERDTVFAEATGDLRTWLALGYFAGLRCHEIAKLHGRDVDRRQLRVLGKGELDAVLPTHPELWAIAQQYPRDGYWFPSPQARHSHVCTNHISSHIRAHFRRLGIDQGSVHRLRHTYAHDLRRSGADIRLIQTLMRHRSLKTTEAYLSINLDEQFEAIQRLHVGLVPASIAA